MQIIPFGEKAVLINFAQKIDLNVNSEVIRLSNQLEDLPHIDFIVPSYCSLLIGYDDQAISLSDVENYVQSAHKKIRKKRRIDSRRFKIPVCYEEEFELDLGDVQQITGLSKKKIISNHTGQEYRVFGIGFLPGFPYLGKLSKRLRCPRKKSPRLEVPRGSVAIAGYQTGIYPAKSPGGWQIIGRTPIPLFRPQATTPFLLQPGDGVTFHAIDSIEFKGMATAIANDLFDWKSLRR